MTLHDSVTTFVPSRSLDDYDEAKFATFNAGARGRRASWSPNETRRRALVRLLKHQEGREVLLQLLQSALLLLYSYAPTRKRRRQMHLLSESTTSIRKFLLVGRWLVEGSSVVQDQIVSLKGEREGTQKEFERKNSDNDSDADMGHQDAVDDWRGSWQSLIESISEYLALGAESCDLLAFFGGSSMLWGILGGKLAKRQRRGLERLALFLAFLSMICSLAHIRQLRNNQSKRLRSANHELLKVTDQVAEEDARRLVQGHALLPQHVMNNESAPRDALTATIEDNGNIDSTLRKREHRLYIEKKKLDHIKLQRTAIRSELIFILIELLQPGQDHSRLEGYTGIIASICHISRLAGESRWSLQ